MPILSGSMVFRSPRTLTRFIYLFARVNLQDKICWPSDQFSFIDTYHKDQKQPDLLNRLHCNIAQ